MLDKSSVYNVLAERMQFLDKRHFQEFHKVRNDWNDLGPEILKDIFHFLQKPYNLRND